MHIQLISLMHAIRKFFYFFSIFHNDFRAYQVSNFRYIFSDCWLLISLHSESDFTGERGILEIRDEKSSSVTRVIVYQVFYYRVKVSHIVSGTSTRHGEKCFIVKHYLDNRQLFWLMMHRYNSFWFFDATFCFITAAYKLALLFTMLSAPLYICFPCIFNFLNFIFRKLPS